MKVRLVVERGAQRRQVIKIEPPGAILGRGKGSTIRIPSAEVSRRHCQLHLVDGVVTVEDLESVNGTLLNGRPIEGIEVVRPKDRLQIGPVTFRVDYQLDQQALARFQEGEASKEDVPELEFLEFDDEVPEEDYLPAIDFNQLERIEEESQAELVEDKPLPEAAIVEDDQPVEPGFDFEKVAWNAPQGGDLRDILAQMEQDAEAEAKPKKKKRPNKGN